jgi:hypothetical protein
LVGVGGAVHRTRFEIVSSIGVPAGNTSTTAARMAAIDLSAQPIVQPDRAQRTEVASEEGRLGS